MPLQKVESVVKRSHVSISNVLSVSAYNTLTAKPIVKKLLLGKQMAFFS